MFHTEPTSPNSGSRAAEPRTARFRRSLPSRYCDTRSLSEVVSSSLLIEDHPYEINEGRIRVLPVVAEECSLPELLRTKKHVSLTSDFDAGLNALVASLHSYIAEDSARDFYAYAPVVLRQVRQDPDRRERNEYWDQFDARVSRLSARDKFRAQRANSLNYLGMWHLTVEQLRVALGSLGYPTPSNNDVTKDLVSALELFQQDQCMRHVCWRLTPAVKMGGSPGSDRIAVHEHLRPRQLALDSA